MCVLKKYGQSAALLFSAGHFHVMGRDKEKGRERGEGVGGSINNTQISVLALNEV